MTPMQQMFLGLGAADKVYIDDVFSPTVWIGNGNNNRDIVNGIDISTEGGMVWIKRRNEDRDHSLFDTIRGAGKMLSINDNTSEDNETNTLTQFNTNGFRLNDDNYVNSNNNTYCSWTFRKCPKFFTMATWSGNATSGRQIAHDLDMVPGAIIVKCYSSNGHAHAMYHRKAHSSQPEKYFYPINTGTGATLYQHAWNNTAPTSTHFTLGNNADFNGSGKDYVAWIFAHNNSDGEFGGQSGADGDVIKCDSYTGNGSAGNSVNVGFEPQFIMLHKQEGGYESAPIYVYDCIRGIVTGGDDPYVQAAFNSAEVTNTNRIKVTATGFTLETSNAAVNENSTVYVYTAIRRPDGYVGKPADAGTDVFGLTYGTNSTNPSYVTNFPVDFSFSRRPATTESWYTAARLIQKEYLVLNDNAAEVSNANQTFDYQNGWHGQSADLRSYFAWSWKRHAGFDVVCYAGDGSTRTINHSMNQSPEMMWFKRRDGTGNWYAYHVGMNGGSSPEDYALQINGNQNQDDNANYFNDTAPTSSVFTLGGGNVLNGSSDDMIAFLFSSVSGISKCGYYTGTGTGSVVTVTTGFQPRLLLLKGTGNSDYWWLLDTTRGWGSGSDQYIPISATDAQNGHDFGAPTSTGFTIPAVNNPSYNGTGQNYIYYAHA